MDGATRFDQDLLELPDFSSDAVAEISFEQKLGHVYEDALAVLLECSGKLDLLEKSLQVFNDEKRTLGELDYLLRIDGKLVHLELAVKFYMIYFQDGVAYCPGPDPTDNWYNKLERLESHQLKMSQNDYAMELLVEKYGTGEVASQHLIYGRLFDHIMEKKRPIPRGMAENGQRSIWLYTSEWNANYPEIQEVTMIPKHLWPVPAKELCDKIIATLRSLSVAEMLAEIFESERCEMIYVSGWRAPIFVVPDRWPNF